MPPITPTTGPSPDPKAKSLIPTLIPTLTLTRITEKNRQLSVGKKILCGVASLLALSVVTSSGLSVAVADLYTKEVKVEDGSLKSTGGNTVATHNRKNVYAASHDFEKNETESRRRLEAGDKVQVAAVTCAAVREAITSLEVGDNEGATKMTMGGGHIFTASVTASSYHTGVIFGIEGIHLDGSLNAVYGVECEEAKCSDTAYQCPVLGLAVTDEGRRRLGARSYGFFRWIRTPPRPPLPADTLLLCLHL